MEFFSSLLEAVRYGDRADVRARLFEQVDGALDREHLTELIARRALTHDTMDARQVEKIRQDMERADAQRLQPHFVASFFLEAFKFLGGTIHERESKRFEIKHVPSVIRTRDRAIGRGQPVLHRYERITFDKNLVNVPGKPLASFVCPGHPLLSSVIDLVTERHRELLRRGAMLVDENDPGTRPRVLLYLEHAIQDGRIDHNGNRRVVSKRFQFIEIDDLETPRSAGPAPYLDYRPLKESEQLAVADYAWPAWVRSNLESKALEHAAMHLVPEHLGELRRRKEELVEKTRQAVLDRLTSEVRYWDHRANDLKEQELAGKLNAKVNSGIARQRADDLAARLQKRLGELDQERQLAALPPVVVGGALIVPLGLLRSLNAAPDDNVPTFARDTAESERRAMAVVMETERRLGFIPKDVSLEKRGYDIESAPADAGNLRFIEVKGRVEGADTVTVTRGEIMTGLNKPNDFILAIVQTSGEPPGVTYIRRAFENEPDFTVTSINFNLAKLLEKGGAPS